MVCSCEHSNETLGCKKYGEFLDQVSDYQLLKHIDQWSQFRNDDHYTAIPGRQTFSTFSNMNEKH